MATYPMLKILYLVTQAGFLYMTTYPMVVCTQNINYLAYKILQIFFQKLNLENHLFQLRYYAYLILVVCSLIYLKR